MGKEKRNENCALFENENDHQTNPSKVETLKMSRTQSLKNLKHKMIFKLKTTGLARIAPEKSVLQRNFKGFFTQRQENFQENGGSTCQFSCPICLEMLMTPCPTSCGHIFCYKCIDESIIRIPTCPSCRNFIRNQEFIESKPYQTMSRYFWETSKQKKQYREKSKRNEEWLRSRKIDPTQLKVNDLIDARDTEHIWCKAKIMEIFKSPSKTQFLIHFEGWNDIYNEVINVKSQRLAPYGFFSNREDIPRYKLSSPEDNMRSRIEYRDFRDRAIDRQRENSTGIQELGLEIQNSLRSSFAIRFSNLRPNQDNSQTEQSEEIEDQQEEEQEQNGSEQQEGGQQNGESIQSSNLGQSQSQPVDQSSSIVISASESNPVQEIIEVDREDDNSMNQFVGQSLGNSPLSASQLIIFSSSEETPQEQQIISNHEIIQRTVVEVLRQQEDEIQTFLARNSTLREREAEERKN